MSLGTGTDAGENFRRLHVMNIETMSAYKISVTNCLIGSTEYKME